MAKNKERAPCVVYFAVVENDEVTVHLSMVGLNKAQSSWYEKHGDRDKFAGICYVAKASDAPAHALLYAVVWGEHSLSQPYTWTSESTRQVTGTVTDDNGNRGTVTMDVPVTRTDSGTVNYRTADGWLAVWDQKAKEGKGDFVPVAPLHSHTATWWPGVAALQSGSSSLLKDAMEQIREREKDRLVPMKITEGSDAKEQNKPPSKRVHHNDDSCPSGAGVSVVEFDHSETWHKTTPSLAETKIALARMTASRFVV